MIRPKCSIETLGKFGYEFCKNQASTKVIWKNGNKEEICGKCFSDLRGDVYDAFKDDIFKITHHNKEYMNVCLKCNGDRVIPVLDESGNKIFILGREYMVRCPKCNGTGSAK